MCATTKEQWIPCLLLEGERTACGATTSYPQRLPGAFDTHSEAMAAAEKVALLHSDAMGYSAKRVEVTHGL